MYWLFIYLNTDTAILALGLYIYSLVSISDSVSCRHEIRRPLFEHLFTLPRCGGVCGIVFNTQNFGSGGPWFRSRPPRCFLRQGTLLHFVSIHPAGVQTGTGDILLGGDPAMD